MDAVFVKAVPTRTFGFNALQIAFTVEFATVIEHIVFSRNIENVLGPAALENFIEGVEFFRLRQLRNISRVDKERRRSGHRVDAIERNLKRRGDILVRLFTKADVAVADLQEAKVSSRQWLPGLCNLSKGLRYENAAADRPKQAGTGPCHALEKAAAINPVMLVIVRNVIGHNIWFLFGCLLFALHLSLLIGRDFIPEIFEGGCESQPRSTSVNNRISVLPIDWRQSCPLFPMTCEKLTVCPFLSARSSSSTVSWRALIVTRMPTSPCLSDRAITR